MDHAVSSSTLLASDADRAPPIATAQLGARHPLLALVTATTDAVRLELHNTYDAASFTVDLQVRGAPQLVVTRGIDDRRVEQTWTMVRGVPGHSPRDVLVQAIQWVRRKRYSGRRGFSVLVSEDAEALLRELAAVVRTAAIAAVERCEPSAHRLAMRFLPHLRFRVYARLVGDPSGRLAQLAATCPGALIFGLALIERTELPTSVAAGERLLADVIDGRRLGAALDDAVDGWLASIPELLAWHASRQVQGGPACEAPEHRAAAARRAEVDAQQLFRRALDPATRAQVRRDQRLLVRRAGFRVPATTLWLPPPIALVPEDIPRGVRDNAAWYREMKVHPVTLTPLDGVDPARQASLSQFVSRNASRARHKALATQRRGYQDLVDCARATGRWPARATDPRQVMEQTRRWHAEMARVRELIELEQMLGHPIDSIENLALPAPRFQMHEVKLAGVELSPIVTARQLIDEGNAMQHCVAGRLPWALGGRVLLFQGAVAGQRVTVELVREQGRWQLGDFRASRNAAPGPQATALIARWVAVAAALQEVRERRDPAFVPPAAAPPAGAPVDECPF